MKITFDFSNRDPEELNYVNQALAGLLLSSLKIEEDQGYLATITEYDREDRVTGVSYRYGFDHLTLACEYDDQKEAHVFQIETLAFAEGEMPDGRIFHDVWSIEHPDRDMRSQRVYSFNGPKAVVIVYHEKT